MITLQEELDNEFTGKSVTISPNEDNTEWTIKVDDVEATVPAGKEDAPKVALLPSAEGTTPYFPSTAFNQVDGTDLNTGLVITDEVDKDRNSTGNEYVWIEVPNSNLGGNPTFGPNYSAQGLTVNKIEGDLTETQKTAIEQALWSYTDSLIARLSTNTDSYPINLNTTTKDCKDEWYSGCGISGAEEYNTLYKNMLKNLYNHGGFWIGRYEAGIENARYENGNIAEILKPLSKANLYPFNYVTCSQAQILANKIDNVDNSSLLFGIQWDCVLKYLQEKNVVDVAGLTSNSSNWGNYREQKITITRGKYWSWDDFASRFLPVNGDFVKNSGKMALFTTGAIPDDMAKQNIYDLAGNEWEWTLEHWTLDYNRGTVRGGGFNLSNHSTPVSNRYAFDPRKWWILYSASVLQFIKFVKRVKLKKFLVCTVYFFITIYLC